MPAKLVKQIVKRTVVTNQTIFNIDCKLHFYVSNMLKVLNFVALPSNNVL